MKNCKQEILRLRSEGKTYNQIQEIIGCSKATISYHCGNGQKTKTAERSKKFYSKRGGLYKKLKGYCLDYCSGTRRGNKSATRNHGKMLDFEAVQEKVGENPICYLTGQPINLENLNEYSLDHIIPLSKGGESNLENLGVATKQANQCKSDLTHEEFIEMCKTVLIHHGYTVS
jgi:CRISPR/Cas system Type II protein with McrA/HNH and RuvC-like nuclease domain